LADDSGLEVDALGGDPGIYSARFAGPDATDADRNRRVLELMEGIPDDLRTARFKAAVAIAIPGRETIVVEGVCEGQITREPRGANGFGYDPIFFIPTLNRTTAELTSEEKNQISHRGKAMRAARGILAEWVNEDTA
jgi:XTP/dITP diphosphohydrolase